MKFSILKEARKISDKFEKQSLKKHLLSSGSDDSGETGRNIDVMSKIKRKAVTEFKGKKRKIPEKKQTTYYIKKYKVSKPYPKEVNGVLEYATYKIVKYYGTINPDIKIPKAIHLSFEEDDKQFTLASSVNYQNKSKANSGLRAMIYRQIANKNAFFFSLIGYTDTHAGNIVATDESNYYLIDFDYAFHPFGDKVLRLWAPQIQVKQVKHALLSSYALYKQINIQKVRNIITDAFKKADKLLDEGVDKLEKKEYEDLKVKLSKLEEMMVNNLYYNKKLIEEFAKYYDFDNELKTFNPNEPDYFDIKSTDGKNLPTSSTS